VPANAETFLLVRGEAARLQRLVDDLQRLSRLEAGQEQLERTALSPYTVIEKALRQATAQFEEKGVTLENLAPPATPAVLADQDRLTQILLNLLGNALRYTPDGGKVSVSAAREQGWLAISVSDTGVGIAPEHLPHVFDRFYRVDESRSRSSGGSGIGLTIVRRLVEAHGGTIRADSRPGEGTTFTFTLPLATGSPR
jgi:signal transduction histidine kinase